MFSVIAVIGLIGFLCCLLWIICFPAGPYRGLRLFLILLFFSFMMCAWFTPEGAQRIWG